MDFKLSRPIVGVMIEIEGIPSDIDPPRAQGLRTRPVSGKLGLSLIGGRDGVNLE
jgi:hypothetical protein